MPTARELLEQADALMRRRREPAEPDPGRGEVTSVMRGPATDPSLEVTESPAPMERVPAATAAPSGPVAAAADAQATATAALSSMRWSAPPPPAAPTTTSPVFAPPPTLSPRTIQREPIAPSVARTALPVDPTESRVFTTTPAISPLASPVDEHDIPLLTDAVGSDELAALDDVPVLTEAVAAMPAELVPDDPDSPGRFADPTIGGPPSLLARGPVTVTPLAERDPLGLDRPPPGFEPPAAAQWVKPAPVQEAPQADDSPAPEPSWSSPPVEPIPFEAAVAAAVPAETPVAPIPFEAAVAAAVPAETPVAPVLAPLDDARVREIAEEIGMQVLQRIDIFTDTELRARLGERLKPVVDRVSADLVAAINQHVGELLRAYVAEAIETEIEPVERPPALKTAPRFAGGIIAGMAILPLCRPGPARSGSTPRAHRRCWRAAARGRPARASTSWPRCWPPARRFRTTTSRAGCRAATTSTASRSTACWSGSPRRDSRTRWRGTTACGASPRRATTVRAPTRTSSAATVVA